MHLAKYVRLWGPLWTQSAFGFESKNGRLKHLFHGNFDIFHQLLFNIDVQHTLQHVQTRLAKSDNERTMQYINHLSHLTPRSNMISIGRQSYVVGQCKATAATLEQSKILGCTGNIEIFFRLLKDQVLYYCTHHRASEEGRRDNTYCCYSNKDNGTVQFGRINVFVNSFTPCALIQQLKPLNPSLLNRAGHPCRDVLSACQQRDLLGTFMFPVKLPTKHSPIVAVPISHILSKVVIVSTSTDNYCIIQPNSIERH